jgi:hypothetical protein
LAAISFQGFAKGATNGLLGPPSAQEHITAAELEAENILTNNRNTANELAAEADRMGLDASGIGCSPGDIPLQGSAEGTRQRP